MIDSRLLKIKKKVRSSTIIAPLLAQYLPYEYEQVYGKYKHNILRRVSAPYRKKRDRRDFQNYLRNTDVFLVGHPKSGNTWMAYMLGILLYKDKQHQINLANLKNYIPLIHGKDSWIRFYTALPSPRIFRNEWVVYPELYPKTIYLVRDPRAVLVSYYHMYRIIADDHKSSIQEFIERYFTDRVGFEPVLRWDIQVLDWRDRAERNTRIMIVKYEDMISDQKNTLADIAKFAGIDYTEEDISLALARSSFKEMQINENTYGSEAYTGERAKRGRFFRRGRVDGWREELGQCGIKRIEHEFYEAMKCFGYL